MKTRLTLVLAASALALSACASITAVPAGPFTLSANHTATLDRAWSDASILMVNHEKEVRLLTIDGPSLNRLYLVGGLPAGKGLTRAMSKDKAVPVFRADMSPTELVEFITDSVAAQGYQRIETAKLRPARYHNADALQFDLKAQTTTGLECAGMVEVAAIDGKLYAVLYLAPSEHYFAASLPNVESLMKSAS